MTDTLHKIIHADKHIPRFYDFTEQVDTVVTNILHRIGGDLKVDFPYWENILNHCERLVPLSLGFAFSNGNVAPLNSGLIHLLKVLAERTEIGVRGEYDAEILNGIGIKNVCVIGCPSLYYHMDSDFRIDEADTSCENVNVNFTTDFNNLGISQRTAVEVHWPVLLYFINIWEQQSVHMDFTMQKPPFTEMSDIHAVLLSYGEVHPFYQACGRYFYSAKDWIHGLKKNDFSIGTRFHGNVAAILAGIPALMINVDKRMEEMNKYYKIPSIDISEFDREKSLGYYRELADYSEFNKNYRKAYDNFTDYCSRCGVKLNVNE
jgi:hypothetical protein